MQIYTQGSVIVDPLPAIAGISPEPYTGGKSGSGHARSQYDTTIPVSLGEAGPFPYLGLFLHFSICFSFILENWIPS